MGRKDAEVKVTFNSEEPGDEATASDDSVGEEEVIDQSTLTAMSGFQGIIDALSATNNKTVFFILRRIIPKSPSVSQRRILTYFAFCNLGEDGSHSSNPHLFCILQFR